jgi:hypothetical protein
MELKMYAGNTNFNISITKGLINKNYAHKFI